MNFGDDAAEIRLAETVLHVVVVKMQRVVVKRSIAKQADRFTRDGEFRTVDRVADSQVLKAGFHECFLFRVAITRV